MDNILDTKFTGLFGEDDKGYPQLYTGAFGTSNIIKRIKGTPATDKFKGSKAFPFKAKYPTNFISCSNIGFIPTIGDNVAAVTGKTNETPAAPKSDNADLPFQYMNWEQTIIELASNNILARKVWTNQYIFMVDILNWGVSEAIMNKLRNEAELQPRLEVVSAAIKTSDNQVILGWKPSEEDRKADDWYIVPLS